MDTTCAAHGHSLDIGPRTLHTETMKIYTRGGDTGQTGLYGGGRVPKDDARIEALGAVDELNAALGVVLTLPMDDTARALLSRIQSELFVLGADLATPLEQGDVVPRVSPREATQLEADIDRLESDLPPLQKFILPGGSPAGAAVHMARGVCRRAERGMVRLMSLADINPQVEAYINRLSDFLFVLARHVNHAARVPETEWTRP